MRYLDANVFLFAARDDGPRGAAARTILKSLGHRPTTAATCTLTVDEVSWGLWRATKERARAAEAAGRILELQGLRILPVTAAVARAAMRIMRAGLDPRDAIHAAAALEAGIVHVVSDDPDFDSIPELQRQPIQ